MEVNHSLVDPHLELVPGLGALSARCLSGGDSQHLGGHPHGSLHLELLVLGAPDEVAADLLQRLDVPGGQSNSDAVDGDILLLAFAILKNLSIIRLGHLKTDKLDLIMYLLEGYYQNSCYRLSEVLANPSRL